MSDDYSSRHIPFEGCFNFRDIGGYPATDGRSVRWGHYYRAGRQDRMTAADMKKFAALGVSTQIDLRKPDEIEDQGRGPLESLDTNYHNISVIPEGGTDALARLVGDTGISGKRYLGYLEFGPESWIRLFEVLASESSPPVVIHCTAGKDRTGVSTAFLLSVLGVPREVIELDYKLTNIDVPRQADFIERTVGYPDGMDRTLMLKAAGVPEDAMGDFLDGLDDRWGGATGYLRSIGIPESTFDAVRKIYLE